ncbi:MAG: acetyltransferase [Chromatiaceae bacterium]|nr:acetyltransferase [Gammaproteobacteria bacterium]MCP5305858.1 acetyltransferase [Chromatiaceae bacterium]MCP5312714.1 acetyltransferase [Chromatiaceae bacterium]
MLLKERKTDELVEVIDSEALFDPFKTQLKGRYNAGEELPEPRMFDKADLVFCSNESLPRCWMDPEYRKAEMIRRSGTDG